MEVIQPGVGIVVIASVAEGVEDRRQGFHHQVCPCDAVITPRVIGVFQYLSATLGVNGNNIAMQILLKIEGVKDIGGVAALSILHTDG